VTGSVKQTAKTQEPNDEKSAVSPAQLAKSGLGPARVEDALEEWAEVSLAARVHNAPSVSAPTVRFYRVGTRLKVIGREPGWIKVIDPSTSKEGWIYEKYLTPKEGPDQKQAGLPTITTASSGGYARRHERLGTPSARALCTILQATQWMEVVPGLSATYRIRVQGVPQLVSSRVTKSQVVKAPRSLSLSGG
jgi:hypothetical protein